MAGVENVVKSNRGSSPTLSRQFLALGLAERPFHFAGSWRVFFSKMEPLTRGFKGIWIPAELWSREDISLTEKCLIAEIESLDSGDGCFASNDYLATFMKISVGRLKNILVDLSRRELVTSYAFDGRRRKLKQTAYRVTAAVTKTLPLTPAVTESLPQQSRFRDPSSNIRDSKEDNKDTIMLISPDVIYGAYPRKVGRQDAVKSIARAMKTIAPPKLLAAVQLYAEAVAQWPEAERKYIPHPSTWFNRGSYDDDPANWKRTPDGNARTQTPNPRLNSNSHPEQYAIFDR